MRAISRRSVLAGAAGGATLAALSPRAAFASTPMARAQALASMGRVGDRPDPTRPAGAPDPTLPYEHVVIVMMENHSFDTYLGMLPKRGQPKADGFTFDGNGKPLNSNPVPGDAKGGRIRSFQLTSTCQGDVSQSWDATHAQINGGRMDGFVGSAGGTTNDTPMGYYDESDLPFYYSLAKTFTLANRWFCSAPCQTYPNRRFLVAATASGDISTDTASLMMPPPANGTILDRLSDASVSWTNYFTDLPGTAVIPSNVTNHPQNYQPATKFFADAAAGTLPSVSFVDPEFGVTSDVGGQLAAYLDTIPNLPPGIGANASSAGGDEESPQNVLNGQYFVSQVVNAVLNSPLWPKTLLLWTYDEHGGYYDHVPPPKAVKPDGIAPDLAKTDVDGAYDLYGPRVPAVVVSPWSRKNDVTNVVHDHTSILATIEMKWNLPTLTARDAAATTVNDFLDFSHAAFLDPPTLAAAQNPAASYPGCSTADYHEAPFFPAAAAGPAPAGTSGAGTYGATVGSASGDRGGDLAFTGLDVLVPIAGTALLGAAAVVARSARTTEDHDS